MGAKERFDFGPYLSSMLARGISGSGEASFLGGLYRFISDKVSFVLGSSNLLVLDLKTGDYLLDSNYLIASKVSSANIFRSGWTASP